MASTDDFPGVDWHQRRRVMVDTQIRARGVINARVLEAIRKVPRHLFVPEEERSRAYDDTPLAIGFGQTISQPFIVAFMTEVIDPQATDRVLEIGTGCGYQTAVLAEVVKEVYTIEVVQPLGERARATLAELGYQNVHTRIDDGYRGWPEAAPFDKIMLTAAPEAMPAALVDQLGVAGLMVVPIGFGDQMLTVVHKTAQGIVTREVMAVRFVPMVGKGGR